MKEPRSFSAEGGFIIEATNATSHYPFTATSAHEHKACDFATLSGAKFWLWAINERCTAAAVRGGQRPATS